MDRFETERRKKKEEKKKRALLSVRQNLAALEEEVDLVLERERAKTERLAGLRVIETQAREREKVVIKLVALERAKVEEMRKQMENERRFAHQKEEEANHLALELSNSPCASRIESSDADHVIEEQKRTIERQAQEIASLKAQLQALQQSPRKMLSPAEKKQKSIVHELIQTEETYLGKRAGREKGKRERG